MQNLLANERDKAWANKVARIFLRLIAKESIKLMNQPPKGYYRHLMPANMSHVRLAIARIPMTNVRRLDSAPVLEVLDVSDNEHAKYYADGLRSGQFVAVEEIEREKIWKPGELFFGS